MRASVAMPRTTIKILFSLHSRNIFENMCKIPQSTDGEERQRFFENSWREEILGFMMTTDLLEWLRMRNFSMPLR